MYEDSPEPSSGLEAVPRTELDPNGKVWFTIQDDEGRPVHTLRCCVNLLTLISPVFAALLDGDFKEGDQVRAGECPTLVLKEDYPKAMVDMLHFLHYRLEDEPELPLSSIASIAIQGNKYACEDLSTYGVVQSSSRGPQRSP